MACMSPTQDFWWNQLSTFTKSWASSVSYQRSQPRHNNQPLPSLTEESVQHITTQSVHRLKEDLLSCLSCDPERARSETLSSLAPDFLSFVATSDLPPSTITRAISEARKALEELLDLHMSGHQEACQRYIHENRIKGIRESGYQAFLETSHATFQASFKDQVSELRAHYRAACDHAREWSSDKKARFNAEYTPFLEKYFQYDPFPSARDREWLAEKTVMTVRQIEVWFQNHRRRARLDGQIIEKASVDRQPASLGWLAEQLLPHLPRPRSQSVESECSTPPPDMHAPTLASSSNCILDSTSSPPHAFPVSFKQSAHLLDQNFPCRGGSFQFETPTWYRRPTKKRPRSEVCSVDELCDKFVEARIWGPPQKKSKTQSTVPWYASRCSGPVLAPLPSLVRPRVSHTSSPLSNTHRSQYPPTPATAPRRKRVAPQSSAASSSPSRPRAHQSRSPIPRSASNSSLASSGSSASEGDDIATPEGSPVSSSRPLVFESSNDSSDPFGSPIISGFAHYASDPQSLLPKSSPHSWLLNSQLTSVSQ
ncbi:hypothetical protein BKA70DRAFT_1251060 [Coprinopsis sp. MPI-PUGE-AT-0042]|nr:hypothetical protein BKA70DRAFT_1251060 [Coprinopsis sp. MPI-PUGE-AT-0042]